MNDWQLSLWISQWLAGELDDAQQSQLQLALQQSPASHTFAQWASRIQAAAAETQRIETMSPDEVSLEPSECLSELSKARLQRAVMDALQQGRPRAEPQQLLRVAQSPSDYASRPALAPAAAYDQQPSDSSQGYDALLRGGRELRGRLTAEFSGMLQTLQWVVEMVALSNAHTARSHDTSGQAAPSQAAPSQAAPSQAASLRAHLPPSPPFIESSDHSALSLQHVGHSIMAMMRVQTNLCGVSIASYHAARFDELLRVQRGPRNLSELCSLPADRLRHAAASPFHQSVFDATAQTARLSLDRSIAGWPRLVLALPLAVPPHPQAEILNDTSQADTSATGTPSTGTPSTGTPSTGTPSTGTPSTGTPSTGTPWGLALVEADIERLVNTQIAAASVAAIVTLLDPHDRVLFSSPPRADAATMSGGPSARDQLPLAGDLTHTGEMHQPAQGSWSTLLSCPAPLDNLRLMLRIG